MDRLTKLTVTPTNNDSNTFSFDTTNAKIINKGIDILDSALYMWLWYQFSLQKWAFFQKMVWCDQNSGHMDQLINLTSILVKKDKDNISSFETLRKIHTKVWYVCAPLTLWLDEGTNLYVCMPGLDHNLGSGGNIGYKA